MFILNELRDSIDAIAARIGDVEPDALAAAMRGLDGEAMLQLMAEASVLANRTERLLTVGAGVIAERSTREQGYAGLAAQMGLIIVNVYGGFENAPDPLTYMWIGPAVGAAVRAATSESSSLPPPFKFGPRAQASPQAHMPQVGSISRALRKARTDSLCSKAQRRRTPWSNQA